MFYVSAGHGGAGIHFGHEKPEILCGAASAAIAAVASIQAKFAAGAAPTGGVI